VHYAAAYGELLVSEGKPPVTFSRAGFTGSQAHGTFWAGDEDSTWDALRASITAGLNAASCGVVYWGWDLAGFSGPTPDAELYLRATALACFVPIMQYHSEFNHHRTPSRDRTPWNIAEQTGDPTVLEVFRRFSKLRQRLIPYLAEQATVTRDIGRPLMRALALADPGDAESWRHPFQYLLGDDLLVSPVTEPGTKELTTYLPPGEWIDVWTGQQTTGPTWITTPTPLDTIGVWCRSARWHTLSEVFQPDHP
jgi:alpha-glucosidase (family GH31 glycosyl hydrolase)